MIGKVVTKELVLVLLRQLSVRLTAQQAAKFVPVAGQLLSATLSFAALRLIGEQHVRQCMELSERLLSLPAPAEV